MQDIKIPKNEYSWLIEPFLECESFIPKRMFGCLACYLHGKLMLVLADSEEPWNGVLVATDKEKHSALKKEFKSLEKHPILGKWLYIPGDDEDFENTVNKLVKYCLENDQRLGVMPKPKKKEKD